MSGSSKPRTVSDDKSWIRLTEAASEPSSPGGASPASCGQAPATGGDEPATGGRPRPPPTGGIPRRPLDTQSDISGCVVSQHAPSQYWMGTECDPEEDVPGPRTKARAAIEAADQEKAELAEMALQIEAARAATGAVHPEQPPAPVTSEALASLPAEDAMARVAQLPSAPPPPQEEDVAPDGADDVPSVVRPGAGPAGQIDFCRRMAASTIRQITLGMGDEEILHSWGRLPPEPEVRRHLITAAVQPQAPMTQAAVQPQAPQAP